MCMLDVCERIEILDTVASHISSICRPHPSNRRLQNDELSQHARRMNRTIVSVGPRRKIDCESNGCRRRKDVRTHISPRTIWTHTVLTHVHKESVNNPVSTRQLNSYRISLSYGSRRVGPAGIVPGINESYQTYTGRRSSLYSGRNVDRCRKDRSQS